MSPLTELITLLFLLLVALAAVAWWTVTAPERAARAAREREERPTRAPRGDVSNDAVRGARAPRKHAPAEGSAVRGPGEAGVTVRPRRRDGDDPFERFLDPERRRRDDSGR